MKLKRQRLSKTHWDSVIIGYKEKEIDDFDSPSEVSDIVEGVRSLLLSNHLQVHNDFLPIHIIEYLPGDKSKLKPHVDSVKFSGGIVAGLSLGAERVMRLSTASDEEGGNEKKIVDVVLPVGSLYVLEKEARYDMAHEMLPFEGEDGEEGEGRIAYIFRDRK